MDFASLMASQIAKSKAPPPSSTSDTTGKSKYIRRAELEAARQSTYLAEQAKAEAEREERLVKKRKLEEEETDRKLAREEKMRRLAEETKVRREEEEARQERQRRKRLGLPEIPLESERKTPPAARDKSEPSEGDEALPNISDEELVSKFRELGEPATLFGESHSSRLRRYHNLTRPSLSAPTRNLSSSAALPVPTTLELVSDSEMLLPAEIPPAKTPERALLYRQLASYFTLVLREWSRALAQRAASVKDSETGRQAAHTHAQCLADLRPLFRRFERGDLDERGDDLLEPIVAIVRAAQQRRYLDANDRYLRLSIGTAAWPIGVTMVGIHERSAREKLHSDFSAAHHHHNRRNRDGSDNNDNKNNKQAHIMADEQTRKFLQSIKRCLTFAQTRWPPEDVGQLMG